MPFPGTQKRTQVSSPSPEPPARELISECLPPAPLPAHHRLDQTMSRLPPGARTMHLVTQFSQQPARHLHTPCRTKPRVSLHFPARSATTLSTYPTAGHYQPSRANYHPSALTQICNVKTGVVLKTLGQQPGRGSRRRSIAPQDAAVESFFATSDFKAHKSQLACIMQLVDNSIKAGKMAPTKQPLRVEDIFLPKKRPANSDSRHNTIPLRNPGAEAYEKLDDRLQWMRHDEQQREQLGSQVKAVIQSRIFGRGNIIAMNTKPDVLKPLTETRQLLRISKRHNRQSAAREAVKVMETAAIQRGLDIEQSQLEKFARSAAQKAKLERQKFAPQHKVRLCFIGMTSRVALWAKQLKLGREEREIARRRDAAALMIQLVFKRKWWYKVKSRKFKRGFLALKRGAAKCAIRMRKRKKEEAAHLLVGFLYSAGHSNRIVTAMLRFYHNVMSIQRTWREFSKWRKSIKSLYLSYWVEIENQPGHKRWFETEVSEEVQMTTSVDPALRDKLIFDDMKLQHEKYVRKNKRFLVDFDQYLKDMKKNKVIDQAMRDLGQKSHLVDQMKQPIKPWHSLPTKALVEALLATGLQVQASGDWIPASAGANITANDSQPQPPAQQSMTRLKRVSLRPELGHVRS